MKTTYRAAGLLCVALLSSGWAQGTAHAGLRAPEEPTFGIHGAAISACDQVLMAYWASGTAPITIFRSVNEGPWEHQLRDPNPRFERVTQPVRYKIVFGDREAVTDSVVPYRCQNS